MKATIDSLNGTVNSFLATLENGEPRVRPYQFILEHDGKPCFYTNSSGGWIRLRGDARFSNGTVIKEKILAKSGVVRGIYKSIDHPNFKVFFLEHGSSQLLEASGQQVQKVDS
ncbi:MAG: hypothetical protein CVV51_04570 [Spirochaetae bacterium HGW-Spirochaetae-7]|nr:MAG: hypothetical protein CVV51_04570 [Spirochaetae bacterium HGW-Spirochaetae-7]